MNPDWSLAQDLVVSCPQCHEIVLISEINCQIFRHGAYKANNEQIPPHTSQVECERLVEGKLIYGCGKPFRIVVDKKKEGDEKFIAIICEYI